MCIWRQCNKDPSASLGMTVLGERIGSQGWCAAFLEDGILVSQPSPLGEGLYGSGFAAFFLLGRCLKVAFKSPVASHSIIRRKGSAHMRGMRSFDSVPTCSGCGFSHIGHFSPLRMTIRGSGLGRHGCGIGIDISKFDNIAGGGYTVGRSI